MELMHQRKSREKKIQKMENGKTIQIKPNNSEWFAYDTLFATLKNDRIFIFYVRFKTPTKIHKHTQSNKQTNNSIQIAITLTLHTLNHDSFMPFPFPFHFINSSIELLNNYQRRWIYIHTHTRKYKTGAPKCAAQTVLLEDLMSQCDRMWIVYL